MADARTAPDPRRFALASQGEGWRLAALALVVRRRSRSCRRSPAARSFRTCSSSSPCSALAQYWNLLAGYAGLVSVGQQAFIGLGAYTLFAATLMLGLDPLIAILLGGIVAALLAVPTALIVFRLRGAYFAIGTWVAAEVFRLILAQVKQLGGGTGTSLGPAITNAMVGLDWIAATFGVRTARGARHCALLAGAPPPRPDAGAGLSPPPLAARTGACRAPRLGGGRGQPRRRCVPDASPDLRACRLGHRDDRRAHLSPEGAHLARRGLLGSRLDGLCHLHRRHRRHRHAGGADHRRHCPLSSSRTISPPSAPGT